MIDAETLRQRCLSKNGAAESFPFGDEVRVFKVMGKIFALIPISNTVSISLKCEPVLAQMLRQTYSGVQPGYHLNKEHWNTVTPGDEIPLDEVLSMIDHSYDLVVGGLPKAQRKALAQNG